MATDPDAELRMLLDSGRLEDNRFDSSEIRQIAECRQRKRQVATLMDKMATLLAQREAAAAGANHSWASVRVFGSSAIEADTLSSDLDLYVTSAGLKSPSLRWSDWSLTTCAKISLLCPSPLSGRPRHRVVRSSALL